MAMPSESMGVEHPLHVVNLHLVQRLRTDYVLGGDTTDDSLVIAMQAVQVR